MSKINNPVEGKINLAEITVEAIKKMSGVDGLKDDSALKQLMGIALLIGGPKYDSTMYSPYGGLDLPFNNAGQRQLVDRLVPLLDREGYQEIVEMPNGNIFYQWTFEKNVDENGRAKKKDLIKVLPYNGNATKEEKVSFCKQYFNIARDMLTEGMKLSICDDRSNFEGFLNTLKRLGSVEDINNLYLEHNRRATLSSSEIYAEQTSATVVNLLLATILKIMEVNINSQAAQNSTNIFKTYLDGVPHNTPDINSTIMPTYLDGVKAGAQDAAVLLGQFVNKHGLGNTDAADKFVLNTTANKKAEVK